LAIERAHAHALSKPWGVVDLRPWSKASCEGRPIGEIWYERANVAATEPSLLIKLLFTSEPLSIQVHPDDAFARSIGLPNGKTEAWYVLSAAPGAKVAIGLKQRQTPKQLRDAIETGTILNLVSWRTVSPDEVISVPARTIHAIGAGIVIAEIQQRSNTTFRLFDHGRLRELQIERGIAAADAGPADFPVKSTRLTDQRALLLANAHFVVERIDLAPASVWRMAVERETWFLVVNGGARMRAAQQSLIFFISLHRGHRRCRRCPCPQLPQPPAPDRRKTTDAPKEPNEIHSTRSIHRKSSPAPVRNCDLYQ
jgi:mannose-6-phosphate isomerase